MNSPSSSASGRHRPKPCTRIADDRCARDSSWLHPKWTWRQGCADDLRLTVTKSIAAGVETPLLCHHWPPNRHIHQEPATPFWDLPASRSERQACAMVTGLVQAALLSTSSQSARPQGRGDSVWQSSSMVRLHRTAHESVIWCTQHIHTQTSRVTAAVRGICGRSPFLVIFVT